MSPQGTDLSLSFNIFCPDIFSAFCIFRAHLPANDWWRLISNPVAFHMSNPLLKICSRLSPWCGRLNQLYLKSTSLVFPKSPDLPVFIVKLPSSFSLSSKLVTFDYVLFSFLSETLPYPHFLQSSQTFLHTIFFFHPFFSSGTILSLAQLYHSCTEGVATSWLLPVTPPLMLPQLSIKSAFLRHCMEPATPLFKHCEGSYQTQAFKPGMQDVLSSGPTYLSTPVS